MSGVTTDWKTRLNDFIKDGIAENTERHAFALANTDAIECAITGWRSDDLGVDPEAGARMVVNISSVHVPAFCEASRTNDPKPYKNGYDLGKYRIGDSPPNDKLKTREIVDEALPLDRGTAPEVYFGAVELNGAGIRFYGDVCLVIGRDALDSDTVILDRNSYDLIRAPIRERVDSNLIHDRANARKKEAEKLKGKWKEHVGPMAALKALEVLGLRARRCTTGQISEAVRDDEDYIEILKIGSFGTGNLQEARFSAAEAAHDALTGDRLFSRPAPRMEALMWRDRRRRAEEQLRSKSVYVRIVTTSGRTRD
jgi:hypothetical protein